jgi:DNA-binding winged helix-turn-helix (wHTH) protein
LAPKAFGVLQYLVEHANRLITHTELIEALWPETFVQPAVLSSHIKDLRRALGDNPKNPRFIETLARRGYRFIAAVSEGARAEAVPIKPPAPKGKLVGRNLAIAQLQNHLQGDAAASTASSLLIGHTVCLRWTRTVHWNSLNEPSDSSTPWTMKSRVQERR